MRDKTTLFYISSCFHFFYLKYRILTNSKPWVVPSVNCSDSNISGFFGIGGINYFLHDLLFSQLLTESNNPSFVWLSCPWWKTRCRICSRFRKITLILVRKFSKGNPGRLADKLHIQLKNLLASVKTVSWISWLKVSRDWIQMRNALESWVIAYSLSTSSIVLGSYLVVLSENSDYS